MMFKKLTYVVVLLMFLSKDLMAQSVNLSEEQRDFIGRTLGGHTLWERILPILDQLVTGKTQQSGQNKEQEKKVAEFVAQHPVLVLTLAKYFTSEELMFISDFLNSRELKNIIGFISQKLVSKDEKFKQDVNVLREEVQIIFNRIKEQMQGKFSSSTPFVSLPIFQLDKENNPFEDKTESIEKALAARQLLEAVLPLAENMIRRRLRAFFKQEVEGVKISIAVSRLKENLKEHPIIIASLVKHFGIKELSKTADFFSSQIIRLMIERVSQRMSSENDQFRRDMQRCVFEIASFPFLPGQSGFNPIFSSFFDEFFKKPQPQAISEGIPSKKPIIEEPQAEEARKPKESSRSKSQELSHHKEGPKKSKVDK